MIEGRRLAILLVVTSTAASEVARWAEPLDPDEPSTRDDEPDEAECVWGWRDDAPPGAPPIAPGDHGQTRE